MGISTGGPGTRPGPGDKTAVTWPPASSPAGNQRRDRSPGTALCGHFRACPTPTPAPIPGEASKELGAGTCAVKEAVNTPSHQVRTADTGGAGTLLLGVTWSRVHRLRCLHSGTTREVTRFTSSREGLHSLSFPHARPPGPSRCPHLNVGVGPGERRPEMRGSRPLPSPSMDG